MKMEFTDINGISSHSIEAISKYELRQATQYLEHTSEIPNTQNTQKMHAVIGAMHNLCQKIEQARNWLDDNEIRKIIKPAWNIHSEAPFVKRLQSWPRGYQGDFETIEMLLHGHSVLDPSHRAYWIDWYALNTAIAYQHRNKLAFQRARVVDGLQGGASILNVGCGGASDLTAIEGLQGQGVSITLVDIDEDALALAADRVSWADQVTCINGDAVRALRTLDGKFDRIVFGGLFDYLDDRAIRLLLKMAFERLLKESGRIVFTNLSTHSTFGVWLEFLASWEMTYRTKNKIFELVEKAEIPTDLLSIKLDSTGLSLLCEIEN